MTKKQKKRRSLRTKMLAINVSVALTAFLLCGILFVVSVSDLVGNYVNHDLNFFLTEMSDNLNVKLSYMETMIYEIRDDRELMNYLQNCGAYEETKREELKENFEHAVSISSEQNQGSGSLPVIDKVYLFDEGGHFFSEFYYALVYSEIERANERAEEVHKTFRTLEGENRQIYFTGENDGLYIACPLLDDRMEPRGTVVFDVNLDSVENILREMNGYEDSFWMLCCESQILDGANTEIVRDSIGEIEATHLYEPGVMTLGKKDYRIYKQQLPFGFSIVLGIMENQVEMVLFNATKIYIIGIVVILVAGLVSFTVFTYKMTKPIQEVMDKMQQVKKGDFETKLPDYDNREFHEISTVFNEMTAYINHLINQVYEKQISIKEMELKFLQTQMNPHFMFNVLNTIALQARMDGNEDVFKMISSFSQLIQAKIYHSDSEKVKMRQELEYVNYYLYLQNFRYGERLSYHIEVEDDRILEMYIPKLCIQLIVENAVVHGIEPKMENGRVNVHIYTGEASVYIEIEDNGVGFDTEGKITLPIREKEKDASHNHVGLNNANHIIRLMYGEEYGLEIYSEPQKGTKVIIHIPFDEGE